MLNWVSVRGEAETADCMTSDSHTIQSRVRTFWSSFMTSLSWFRHLDTFGKHSTARSSLWQCFVLSCGVVEIIFNCTVESVPAFYRTGLCYSSMSIDPHSTHPSPALPCPQAIKHSWTPAPSVQWPLSTTGPEPRSGLSRILNIK